MPVERTTQDALDSLHDAAFFESSITFHSDGKIVIKKQKETLEEGKLEDFSTDLLHALRNALATIDRKAKKLIIERDDE